MDACLIGAGGVRGNNYFRIKFPPHIHTKETGIVHLELWAIIIGAGGVRGNNYFRIKFPPHIHTKETGIVHLELWAIIIGVKLWGEQLRGKIIHTQTDNKAIAQIVNSGCSKDLLLQKLLRELVWWLSIFEFKIKTVHLPGFLNKKPDLLSRWHEGEKIQQEFYNLGGRDMERTMVPDKFLTFTHNW